MYKKNVLAVLDSLTEQIDNKFFFEDLQNIIKNEELSFEDLQEIKQKMEILLGSLNGKRQKLFEEMAKQDHNAKAYKKYMNQST